MSIETHLDRARTRVERERETVAAKSAALETFADRVGSIQPAGPSGGSVGSGVTAPVSTRSASRSQDRRDAVRSAFAETVARETAEEGIAAIKSELGDDAAVALAPTVDVRFTPTLKKQLLTAVTARRQELAVTETALETEAESLDRAAGTVDEAVGWLASADETPLSELGFDGLRERHERLGAYCEACTGVTDRRQTVLHSTTGEAGQVGVSHRSLVASLYGDFPVTYPVLSTVTRLREVCEDAKSAVRAHLVRRV